MAFRGQRFVLDLDDEEDQAPPVIDPQDSSSFSLPGMIGEIREREPTAAPAPPKPPSAGFPAHRRRAKPSAFKQRRDAPSTAPAPAASVSGPVDEKTEIGQENSRHLAAMSADQIQAEREELLESMDTSLLEKFLRRARIDSPEESSTPRPGPSASSPPPTTRSTEPTPSQQVPSAPKPTIKPESAPRKDQDKATSQLDDRAPTHLPDDLHPASEFPTDGAVHFPTPPSQSSTMPNLDPSSPSFLSDLQKHYFPNISHDPSALSWLKPPSAEADAPDAESAYHPASEAQAVHPANLRFSLVGTVLSPSTSLALPTTLGLHHHGNDPHAAGYTIPELAILSRSSFPAQRCVAWQVLGRILFRLGKGEFGERGSTLVEGLWSVVEQERVVAGMLAEADGGSSDTKRDKEQKAAPGPSGVGSGIGRHASAKAWAVEGVWLWQSGGGGDRGILKEGEFRSQ
ncbi:transcription factor Rba50 [Aspergillus steynii IBT 23096]|uniref:Transcription factor Rba50 n=1 Tax=Aspergillus steynii IBT 23096 TaxID=1392250 RepID=A0A2I2GFP4_9EURO|nr:transcription factor Rba50 [Aspergillus steynii IBT 23096]PLB51704.1 transcription factor Rba50 [Aspergillus steynii IBT 23096]